MLRVFSSVRNSIPVLSEVTCDTDEKFQYVKSELDFYMKVEGLNFFEAMYFLMVTASTVGYGDISPKDPFGRVIAAVACLWGIILLALVCLVVTDHLSLNSSEARLLRILQDA